MRKEFLVLDFRLKSEKQIPLGNSKLYYRQFCKSRQTIRIQTDEQINCERENLVVQEIQSVQVD